MARYRVTGQFSQYHPDYRKRMGLRSTLASIEQYVKQTLKPFHRVWDETLLAAVIQFCVEGLGIRFDIIQCHSLPHDVQQRLIRVGGSRVNNIFRPVITARQHRSQERNRHEAMERLCLSSRKSAEVPSPRPKWRRSHPENQSRLEQKRRQSDVKQARRRVEF